MSRMYQLVLPGTKPGRPRYEYACEECFAATLDKFPSVMHVDRHQPRPNEVCPQCGRQCDETP